LITFTGLSGEVPRNPGFDTFGGPEGLSQSSVNAIHQDRFGYIWIATQDGINIFDGRSFHVFRQEPFDETSILGSWVEQIFEQVDGTIWAVSNKGLNRFHRRERRFQRFPPAKGDDHLPDYEGTITGLADDALGRVWIGTSEGSLVVFDPETEIFETRAFFPKRLARPPVTTLFRDRHDRLWATTQGAGLLQFSISEDRWRGFDDLENAPATIGYTGMRRKKKVIVEGARGLWLATREGLYLFDPKTERFTHIPGSPPLERLAAGDQGALWGLTGGATVMRLDREEDRLTIFEAYAEGAHQSRLPTDLMVDRDGRVWFASLDRGLFYHENGAFTMLEHRPRDPESPPVPPSSVVYEDRGGNIWVGGAGTGLTKYSPSKHKIKGGSDYQRHGDLAHTIVWALQEDRAGRVWVGTQNRGLIRLSPDRATIEARYYPGDGREDSLPTYLVQSLHEDPQGTIWVGTPWLRDGNQNGLHRYDPERDAFDSFWSPGMVVFIDHSERDGQLYLGTSDSFDTFDAERKQARRVPMNGIATLPVFTWGFSEHPDGAFWIAADNGLFRWDPETLAARHYIYDEANREGLSDTGIISVLCDSKGRVWAGTLSGGLNRYHPERDAFSHLTMGQGMPSNTVYGILETAGELWLSTTHGVVRYDPETGSLRNYTTSDGLRSNELNSGAYHLTRNGELMFGGLAGFDVFSPDDLAVTSPAPPLVLSASKNNHDLIGHDLPNGFRVTLAPEDRLVHFDFAALDFTDPVRNQYRYRLEGFDEDWIESGRGEVTYTNLDHGDYQFWVQGANSDQVWSAPVRATVVVRPAFYETSLFTMFWVLGLIVTMAVVLLLQRRRHARRQALALRERDLARKSEELAFARGLQLAMLPGGDHRHEGFEIAGQMQTASEVGGDYYDFFSLSDGRLCVAYGDATGHGVAAGLVVGMVKMAATLWARQPQMPAEAMMRELNIALKTSLPSKGMGMALAFALLDPKGGRAELISCGMPFPHIYDRQRGILQRLALKAPPLGYLNELDPAVMTTEIHPGDLLVFLSDGFSERFNRDNQIWGMDALTGTLEHICSTSQSAETVAGELIRACDHFAGGRANDDDMTAVVVHYRGPKMMPTPRQRDREVSLGV